MKYHDFVSFITRCTGGKTHHNIVRTDALDMLVFVSDNYDSAKSKIGDDRWLYFEYNLEIDPVSGTDPQEYITAVGILLKTLWSFYLEAVASCEFEDHLPVKDNPMNLKPYIKDIPDFPKPGILFRDISPLLNQQIILTKAMDLMSNWIDDMKADCIAAIESRGFIFGSIAAQQTGLPLVLVRKPGKLPGKTTGIQYDLEYGKNELHAQEGVLRRRVVIIDDILATGGTAQAACQLVELQKGKVAGCAFLLELSELNGRNKLRGPLYVAERY